LETKRKRIMEMSEEKKPYFQDIDTVEGPTEIESYCMNCGQNGTTRLLLTKIPHFKEIILMAFECPHCGFRNSEVQSGQAINEKACIVSCQMLNQKDLNRQVVRSESATVRIPEIDFEIPPTTKNGSLTTVEGILQNAHDGLSQEQPIRKYTDPENYEKVEAFLEKLNNLRELKPTFHLELRDPSGNSYVENYCAPKEDPQIKTEWYTRSEEEDEFLGLAKPALEEDAENGNQEQENEEEKEKEEEEEEEQKEVMEFPGNCYHCNMPVPCRMHVISIPFFKEVIIMASACEYCGYKTNEVKTGGAIAPKGKKITLKMTEPEDLSRDILKSESCIVRIPEVELELTPGTLGGKFTTVEGLLQQVYDEIKVRNPFAIGDSAYEEQVPFAKFLKKLDSVLKFEIQPTLILDDPLGTSYLQNLYAPDPDPNMTIEEYERNWDQNEMFGLNDMKESDEIEDGNQNEGDQN